MTRLAVVTPSFGPDFELCADLHRSVLAHSPDSVHHHIVVPRRDLETFAQLRDARTHIHDEGDFLPRSFVPVPGMKYSVNLRRPFPPLRGWIIQQILKLSFAARAEADVVVLVDSDIEFVRPFGPETFVQDGVVRFFRVPGEIDERLPRHVTWHHTARTLLGLPPAQPPFTDYISSLLAWDPVILRQLLARIETVTGKPWASAIGAQLHFSEWTLYGVFLDEVLGGPAASFTADHPRCHNYWGEEPLDKSSAEAFVNELRPDDIAVMISAKSRTPLWVRRAALNRLGASLAGAAALAKESLA